MRLFTILLFFVHAVFAAASNTDIFSWITPLVEYLKDENCDIYIFGMNNDKLKAISQVERISFFILDKKTVITVNDKGRTCKALIYEVNGMAEADVAHQVNAFHKKYIINARDNEVDQRKDFSTPTVLFRTSTDSETEIWTGCPNHRNIRNSNLWKLGTGPLFESRKVCSNNLRGSVLSVVASGIYPYTYKAKDGTLTGTDITLLKIIAEKLQFSYILTNEGNGTGSKINNSWTGVIGKVLRGNATLGIGGCTMSGERHTVVDFTTPVQEQNLYLFARKYEMLSSYMNFITPFTLSAWMAICFSLLLSTMTLMILGHVTIVKKREDKHLWENLFVCFKLQMMEPGVQMKTKLLSPWIFFGFWCVASFFINAFYICNFRAYLMKSHYEKPLDSLEDTIEQKREIYFSTGSYIVDLLAFSPVDSWRKLFREADAKKLYYCYVNGRIPKDVLDDMIVNGRVQIYSRTVAQAYFPDFEKMYGSVPFRVGKNVIFPFYYGYLLPRRVFWRDDVNNVILRLVQGGIPQFLEAKLIKAKYLQDEEEDHRGKRFDFDHVLGCLMFLVGGLCLSLLAFVVEVMIMYKRPLTLVRDMEMQVRTLASKDKSH